MRGRKISVLLVISLLLGGCSAYYKPVSEDAGPSLPVSIQIQEETETAESAPGPGETGAEGETVASLTLPAAMGAAMNPEIIIATDIHYLAKELTDFGEAFETMAENGDGKVVPYVWEIVDAFLDAMVERKPQALILSGDLTLEGELSSHEALAQKLARVERAGVDVVVIPGNHDINNTHAARYQGTSTVPAERTAPEDFARIYERYGYGEALSRDPASLSYLYELDDGTWLLMLDSCQYEKGNLVGGLIRPETYDWMEEWLEQAWEAKRQVIAVAHHNLLDESRIYEENCTIEHSEELERMLDDWGVTLFLSGHLHVQHYRESRSYDINEIVTSSLAMYPCQYGVLKYFNSKKYDYHTERVDVKGWAERHDNPDVNLEDFDNYASEYLQAVFYNQAYQALDDKDITPDDRDAMADFYAYLNVYAVAGKCVDIREDALDSWGYLVWKEYDRTDIQSMYLKEIIEDAVCDYNTFQRDDDETSKAPAEPGG